MYRTLLVDDRKIFRIELRRLPVWGDRSGFALAGEAADGQQALALLRQQPYDLVITDIQMPKVDGIELLKAIKAEQLCPCVVLLSEYAKFSYARNGLVLGAFDYLVKPVDKEKLGALFGRVAKHLASDAAGGRQRANVADGYAAAGIRRVAEEAAAGRQGAAVGAEEVLSSLHDFCHGQLQQTIASGNRTMFAILGAVWEQCPWLRHYYQRGTFAGIVHQPFASFEDYCALWKQIIGYITGAVHQFLPLDANTTVGCICVYMLEHPEEDISLQTMAGLFYINRSYLSGAFHKKMGIPFNAYLQKIRMTHARLLMETERLRPEQLCARLGYRDADYFTRLFKKTVGVPLAFFLKNAPGPEANRDKSATEDSYRWITERNG